ncbi:MAG TPA: DEAD/DEAH box helicase [Thermoplasmatales archaeon]|nr:DEAD/DEAH box helicase [Thermoplasmatales archaeon]HEX08605.1 DEAD/DEAH box helicase [Thermoplasmatales archaeon]
MNVKELPFSEEVLSIFKEWGIEEFYPPQAEAIPLALDGKNLVLSIPTAAGKSLVAYIAILHKLLKEGGKALYVVPLKALAREKYEELQSFKKIGFKIALSTGDLDESDPRLGRYDIIVCTSEKADSLLRHGASWLKEVKVLVVDEIHLINDSTRGPTLEIVIARLRLMNRDIQIVALSATIKNADELAKWLNAELVKSNWRPVPLKEGVCYNGLIEFTDGTKKILLVDTKKGVIPALVIDSITEGGQVLVFVNTRRSTVALAKKLANEIKKLLNEEEKKQLKKISNDILKGEAEPTIVGETLAKCIENGVAFHNAGLSSFQRRIVERKFREHIIKCIVATPTLAAGVNIPARRVIIRDLWRYDPLFGMRPIPILEYKQQAGRAGRPRYDRIGEAIVAINNERQKDQILYGYLLSDTEPIYSKLGTESALRMHLLSAISTNIANSVKDIYDFIGNCFYAQQADLSRLRGDIDKVIEFLLENGFIEKQNTWYVSTLFGSKTSSLYIDPLSALIMKDALEASHKIKTEPLSYLHAICSTPDMKSLYIRNSDDWVEEKIERRQSAIITEIPNYYESEYEWFLSYAKTAFLLEDWINELPENEIVKKYDIGPGDLYNITETARWLLHAMRELARIYNFNCVPELTELIVRVENGCKKELLNLIQLRGIGRVRARALFNAGFKTISDLRKADIERIARVKTIGKRLAESIKKQVESKRKMRSI